MVGPAPRSSPRSADATITRSWSESTRRSGPPPGLGASRPRRRSGHGFRRALHTAFSAIVVRVVVLWGSWAFRLCCGVVWAVVAGIGGYLPGLLLSAWWRADPARVHAATIEFAVPRRG